MSSTFQHTGQTVYIVYDEGRILDVADSEDTAKRLIAEAWDGKAKYIAYHVLTVVEDE